MEFRRQSQIGDLLPSEYGGQLLSSQLCPTAPTSPERLFSHFAIELHGANKEQVVIFIQLVVTQKPAELTCESCLQFSSLHFSLL
jgi:hypothetical protein